MRCRICRAPTRTARSTLSPTVSSLTTEARPAVPWRRTRARTHRQSTQATGVVDTRPLPLESTRSAVAGDGGYRTRAADIGPGGRARHALVAAGPSNRDIGDRLNVTLAGSGRQPCAPRPPGGAAGMTLGLHALGIGIGSSRKGFVVTRGVVRATRGRRPAAGGWVSDPCCRMGVWRPASGGTSCRQRCPVGRATAAVYPIAAASRPVRKE